MAEGTDMFFFLMNISDDNSYPFLVAYYIGTNILLNIFNLI